MTGRQPQGPRASRRFGMYFLGVAIGCVLVGFLLSARKLITAPPPDGQPVGTPAPGTP